MRRSRKLRCTRWMVAPHFGQCRSVREAVCNSLLRRLAKMAVAAAMTSRKPTASEMVNCDTDACSAAPRPTRVWAIWSKKDPILFEMPLWTVESPERRTTPAPRTTSMMTSGYDHRKRKTGFSRRGWRRRLCWFCVTTALSSAVSKTTPGSDAPAARLQCSADNSACAEPVAHAISGPGARPSRRVSSAVTANAPPRGRATLMAPFSSPIHSVLSCAGIRNI